MSGGGGVDLTGLTPEQIATTAGTGLKTADLNRLTASNIATIMNNLRSSDRAERTHALNLLKFGQDAEKLELEEKKNVWQEDAARARIGGNEAYARTLDAKADIIDRIQKGEDVSAAERKFAGAYVTPPTIKKPTMGEKNIDSTLSNALFKTIQDEEGKILDDPSSEAIEQLGRTAVEHGRELLEIPIGVAEDSSFWGVAKPKRKIYMIVRKGEKPSNKRILRHLSTVYKYDPEEIEYLKGRM